MAYTLKRISRTGRLAAFEAEELLVASTATSLSISWMLLARAPVSAWTLDSGFWILDPSFLSTADSHFHQDAVDCLKKKAQSTLSSMTLSCIEHNHGFNLASGSGTAASR
ncbi:hypothetical protein V8C43DRAFT_218761 [Trichoderma afarasin]